MINRQNIFYDLEDHFSSAISLKNHAAGENSIAYLAGISAANFNVLLQRNATQEPELIINSAKDFFAQNNVSSWTYVVPSLLDTPSLQSALANFVFEESSTAMYYSFGDNSTQHIQTLAIQQVEPSQSDWLEILDIAFKGVGPTTNQYSQALQRAKTKGVDMQHFLGRFNDEPASAITLTFLNDGLRIDNVATHPKYQRFGYASQMVEFGIDLAKSREIKHGFLDASSQGIDLYKRLGFTEIFTYHMYTCK